MASVFPISLSGNSLGTRHRQFQQLVREASGQDAIVPLAIQSPSTLAPLDRLFSIHLASKRRDVSYIVQNLKDEDMLYVSTALKSTWLLEPSHADIINPTYLEDVLYPEMTTTAVNKMKHWIHLKLKDSQRCQEFYNFYSSKNIDLALKFLPNCSTEFILSIVPDILDKLKPQMLKVLSEKCPQVAKMYFDSFEKNETVVSNYLKDEKKIYNNLRILLKLDADIFLDITEKYFNTYSFKRFSPEATKYILTNHKSRFDNKPELYTVWLLNMKTLAKYLPKDEIKEIIIKLARAKYLGPWFTYKNVEPLIKSLSVDERSQFKKQIFVDKSFGDPIEEWPYKQPSSPGTKHKDKHVFEDIDQHSDRYEEMEDCVELRAMPMKMRCAMKAYACCPILKRKTSLDQLFDNYRFMSFEKTLFELRKKITAANMKSRQNMILVLVSKSGSRPECVGELMQLLTMRHENEPANVRATVVRSLVRRCFAWRLPQTTWDAILKYGHDLGLDGRPSTVACNEGLHAVVLRDMLLDQVTEPAVHDAYLENFSTLKEYTLNAAERRVVIVKLPKLLLAAVEADNDRAIRHLQKLLDFLDAYNIRADKSPGVVSAIATVAGQNVKGQSLLRRLFNAHVARRQLFKENFQIIQNDASYLNALRHDIDLLLSGQEFEALVKSDKLHHERFLRSLKLFFCEQNGLADKYLSILEKSAEEPTGKSGKKLARHLAILVGEKLLPTLEKYNDSSNGSARAFAASLRANAHLSRPLYDLNAVDWKQIGAKAVANRVVTSSARNVERYIEPLLGWRHTMRIALLLSTRIKKEVAVFTIVAEKRPKLAVKTALLYMHRGIATDPRMWDIITTLIPKLDVDFSDKQNKRLRNALNKVSVVPSDKKPYYCGAVFECLQKTSKISIATPMLHHLEVIVSEVDEVFLERIIEKFLNEIFIAEKIPENDYTFETCTNLYIRIIAKFLILAKTETTQIKRLKNIGELFFKRIEDIWAKSEKKTVVIGYIDEFVSNLQYSKVFMNTQYVSCLPVIEKTTEWMQRLLPIEMNFGKYVKLHLTMLYFKSIRQSIKNNPQVFEDSSRKLEEGVEIVGFVFGKYIGHEIVELTAKYFDSIRQMYKVQLVYYLRHSFPYGSPRNKLIEFIIKGILAHENAKTHLLAVHIYNSENHDFKDAVREELIKLFMEKNNQEVEFFLDNNV